MTEIAPLKYYEYNNIEVLVENKTVTKLTITLLALDKPFRYYIGKIIKFSIHGDKFFGYATLNNIIDMGSYYKFVFVDYDTTIRDQVSISDRLIIKDTFPITNNNEVATIQDIHDKVITTKTDFSTHKLIDTFPTDGKSGLFTGVEKFKLETQPMFLKYDAKFGLGQWKETLKLKLYSGLNRYKIYFYVVATRTVASFTIINLNDSFALEDVNSDVEFDIGLKYYSYEDEAHVYHNYVGLYLGDFYETLTLYIGITKEEDYILPPGLILRASSEMELNGTFKFRLRTTLNYVNRDDEKHLVINNQQP